MQPRSKSIIHIMILFALLASLFGSAVTITPARAASLQTDITGPSGSGQFGYSVTTLSNGNFVVADPYYDAPGPIADVGAVYLYNGATHVLISTLTGSTANDQVGFGGVTALTNGNYVVASPNWDGAAANVGAVTWGSGTTGVSGTVSAANSLVGSTTDDLNYVGVTALTNGNYVVMSSGWDGAAVDVGAATWGNGTSGISGTVSAANSLVGSTASDFVGYGITALTNGNYVVVTSYWDGAAANVGAVTWGSGTSGVSGAVSAANSLVGSTTDDLNFVSVTALTNGNYVVASQFWDNGVAANVGAATWGSGTGGTVGAVSAANSLVGSTAGDQVGAYGITALTNGNYVVRSPNWDGAAVNVGAVTWGNGLGGTVGAVSAANSLVGSTASDQVGLGGIYALTNGNYVVMSSGWDGAVANVGAVTWGSGTSGVSGAVSAANSLFGSTANDNVGYGSVTALTNGNYVVASPNWDGAAVNVGAATWGSGLGGTVGAVSAANSLVGSTANDQVGSCMGVFIGTCFSVTALSNGNYVVVSDHWDGAAVDVGAATWGSGTGGTVGTVSAANSLVGSTAGDNVGTYGVKALMNGNYVVRSIRWDGAAVDVGAVTWGNGLGGTVGAVSATNSLVGSTAGDQIGDDISYSITALTNGNYVVTSSLWDGAAVDSGAITLGKGTGTLPVGPITAGNSVRGSAASSGGSMNFKYDDVNDQLVVGRPVDNIVTLFSYDDIVPTVNSITRVNSNPTSTANVDFTVTFSESVNGVSADDFSLTTTGVSGATISGVSGSGSVYTVSVSTGAGSGTLRLDVVNDGTIKDPSLNPLSAGYTSGEVYTISKSAVFVDVPLSYWANGFIERLYNAHVTGGCVTNPLSYCPDSTVTRAQMAVFLLKGIHGSNYTPPAINGNTGFGDVAVDHWAAAWIKQLSAEGITSGCGAGIYCPEAPVTRAQMAVFLLKSKHGASYVPANATGVFTDVPVGYWADKWIEQLAAEGVTSGCGNGNYCPDANVTRAQMAVFLVKTFNLP